jgi:hypothetical protein
MIGGLIKVLNKEGGHALFGITAGHFLAQEQYEEDREGQDEFEDDLEDDFSDEGDAFELDLTSLETELLMEGDIPFGRAETPGESEQIPGSWPKIGHVHKASQDGLQDRPNLDWALITIENQSLYLPNVVMTHEVTRFSFPSMTGSERKVVLATAISQSESGTLSRSWSYLMLAPGKSLVRTYLLTLSDNKGMNFLLEDYYNTNRLLTLQLCNLVTAEPGSLMTKLMRFMDTLLPLMCLEGLTLFQLTTYFRI